ncbi:MAG TPA: hypothetical protein ENH96_05120 [Chlamydiae bacterium]|nr:hypothetical protein [Chlamydiota bacterium]
MASVTGIANTGASSKVQESFFTKISKNITVEKVKKLAMPILIIAGLLLADIGAAFLNVSLPVLGATIITSAIALIAYAILKINQSKDTNKTK